MHMPDAYYDLLILGAGPAGSAAAIQAAKAGLRVAVVERAMFPRHRPGETLHPGVEPLLRQLGVAEAVNTAGFERPVGYWVQWGTESPRYEAYGRDATGEWRGYQADRACFDTILLAAAKAAGARVLQPCQAMRPLLTAGTVTGVQTSSGDFRAALVVDATGRGQWLARHLGLPKTLRSAPLRAFYGYLTGPPDFARQPWLLGDATGWAWLAPLAPNRLAWVRLWHKIPAQFPSLTSCLAGLPLDPVAWVPAGRAVRAEDVTWRCAVPPIGPGYLLAGDAATVLDSSAGHGVLKALMSGIMAAHVAQLYLSGTCQPEPIATYAAWLTDGFTYDVDMLHAWYARLGVAFQAQADKNRRT